MTFNTYGDKANPGLFLIPGLGDPLRYRKTSVFIQEEKGDPMRPNLVDNRFSERSDPGGLGD